LATKAKIHLEMKETWHAIDTLNHALVLFGRVVSEKQDEDL
jgi:hypothetical protein